MATPSPLRVTVVGRILSVKVPKKPNEMKTDLLNSTAPPPRKRKLEGERIGLGYS